MEEANIFFCKCQGGYCAGLQTFSVMLYYKVAGSKPHFIFRPNTITINSYLSTRENNIYTSIYYDELK